MSGYSIPDGETTVELLVKNSRFIGTVGHADTVDRAKSCIDRVRARYPDASHHVYAFAVGYGASVTHGMSDAGEPSGTAGRPTLAVVQGVGLGDVVVVTSRYFGGTRLGTGGLVRAYTATAQKALAAAPTRLRVIWARFGLEVAYPLYPVCRRLLDDHGVRIEAEDFAASVSVRAACPRERLPRVRAALREVSSGRVTVRVLA